MIKGIKLNGSFVPFARTGTGSWQYQNWCLVPVGFYNSGKVSMWQAYHKDHASIVTHDDTMYQALDRLVATLAAHGVYPPI